MQQKSCTNVTITQLRFSCNAKNKKFGQIFCGQEYCPCPAARELFIKGWTAGSADAEPSEYILPECINYEYILQITHKDTN